MHEIVLRGGERGAGARGEAQLVVDVLHVVLNGLGRDRQRARNRLVRQAGSMVAAELVFTGEQTGPYPTPAGAMPPSGRHVAFESVDIVEVNAGASPRGACTWTRPR